MSSGDGTAGQHLAALPAAERALLREAPDGAALAERPMLAVLTDRREFRDRWVFERKLDGVRALAVRDDDATRSTRLLSRNHLPLAATYPELAEALDRQPCSDFTVDGEIVAFSGGRTDFAQLQQRMQLTRPAQVRASGVAVFYYVFDLLRLDGVDLTRLSLRTRKALLRSVLEFRSPLRFTPHRNTGGQDLLDKACADGWEGLIAKRAEGRYVSGRSEDWLKLKCQANQEFVVAGWTEPAGSRTGFGALLLGYWEGDRLRYAGRVGTGFDRATLRSLSGRLGQLAVGSKPFADPVRQSGSHWVRPELVAEVAFTEWTRDGMLRHPRYLGLRQDKDPRQVVRERPGRPGQPG